MSRLSDAISAAQDDDDVTATADNREPPTYLASAPRPPVQ